MGIFARTQLPDDDTLLQAAREALTHPPNSSFSDDNLFVTWGLTVGMHRDSDLADTSNFERIAEDMRHVFPADVHIVHSGHWAVGWLDQLAVRVLEPWADPYDYTARDITRAFRVITSIAAYLHEQYPLYDESDYSQREYEQNEEYRRSAWDDTVYALWLKYDVDSEDVTEADREVFDELWHAAEDHYGIGEAYIDRNITAAAIMAAREERS